MASRKGSPFSADVEDTITPEKVTWAAGSKRSGAKRHYVLKVVSVVVALVAVLVGGGFLLRYLSKNPIYVVPVPGENATKQPETEKVPVEAPSPVAPAPRARTEAPVEAPPRARAPRDTRVESKPIDPARLALEKADGEKELEGFLGAKRVLDGKGGAEWGGQRYAEMVQLGQTADAHFVGKEYRSAATKYRQAAALANELLARSGDVLRRMIEEGGVALVAENGGLARRKFRIASLIDPSNEFARRSLERAETVESVGRLIVSGERHEQGDNLSFAYADYQQALKLDPESPRARAAVDRVKGNIAEGQFQELMSKGLTEYHNQEYEVARATLLQARSFHPGSREVADALAQVDQGIRLARMDELRQEALAAEQSEEWEQALQDYTDVLEIDPAIQFALQGRERSLEQIRVAKRLRFYLEKPQVLESDRHLQNAIQLVADASGIDPKGPRLSALIDKLDEHVQLANTPVKITLASDNRTNVAVYKVDQFGRFDVREIALRPGTYTVVGTRTGYRDVRKKIVVKAAQEALRVTVECREEI